MFAGAGVGRHAAVSAGLGLRVPGQGAGQGHHHVYQALVALVALVSTS